MHYNKTVLEPMYVNPNVHIFTVKMHPSSQAVQSQMKDPFKNSYNCYGYESSDLGQLRYRTAGLPRALKSA